MRSYFSRDPKSIDDGLILRHVIGGVEVEVDGVMELVSLRQHEDDSRVVASLDVRSVKIHGPTFWVFDGGSACTSVHSTTKSARA